MKPLSTWHMRLNLVTIWEMRGRCFRLRAFHQIRRVHAPHARIHWYESAISRLSALIRLGVVTSWIKRTLCRICYSYITQFLLLTSQQLRISVRSIYKVVYLFRKICSKPSQTVPFNDVTTQWDYPWSQPCTADWCWSNIYINGRIT